MLTIIVTAAQMGQGALLSSPLICSFLVGSNSSHYLGFNLRPPHPPNRHPVAPTGPPKRNSYSSILLSYLCLEHRKPVPYLRQYVRALSPCVRVDVASIEPRTLGQRRGCELARYGQSFKNRAVARLLPPESASLEEVAREVGVGVWTLERWRSEALTRPARERAWTAAASLEAG